MPDIYIYNGILQEIERSVGSETGIPPGASLFAGDHWETLCSEAGGEAALIESLGVKDVREPNGKI
jgi:hypothetical protein